MEYWFADLEAYSLKYYLKHNRVDAYVIGAKDLQGEEFIWNVNMEEWIEQLVERRTSMTLFFHNLSGYDGQFLMPMLIKKYGMKNITYFIDDKKKIFEITLTRRYRDYLELNKQGKPKRKKYVIKFRDSWKIWPMPLEDLGKAVGKEKLDYGEYDILDTFETNEDYAAHNEGKSLEYFERDIDILREFALQTEDIMKLEDYKMTMASTAKHNWGKTNVPLANNIRWATKNKEVIEYFQYGNKTVEERWLSDYDAWRTIKKAYKGGITWVKPKYQLKELKDIYVYDINSMYPAIMMKKPMPYGNPIKDESLIDSTHSYRIYQVNIKYAKTDKMPFIAQPKEQEEELILSVFKGLEKGQLLNASEEQYPQELHNCVVTMNNYTLMIFEQYYTGEWEKEFKLGYRETYGGFDSYLNKYKEIKENSTGAKRQLAKLFSNSLYGKFGQDIKDSFCEVYVEEEIKDQLTYTENSVFLDGKLCIRNDGLIIAPKDNGLKREISFIAMAEAISSKARVELVLAINENWDNFVYCDTDSIHLTAPATYITLDDNKYGDWAFEGKWDRAVYRRAKHYYHINNDGKYELKGGGFNINNYNPNNLPMEQYLQPEFVVPNGKTNSYTVDGGVIILNGDYKFSMPTWYTGGDDTC